MAINSGTSTFSTSLNVGGYFKTCFGNRQTLGLKLLLITSIKIMDGYF